MAIITDNQLKGNAGANLLASRLSHYCYVRPVTADTDVGIDLYCETRDKEEKEPFLHFWVQVKAGKQCTLSDDKTVCSFDFKTDDLKYWKRQPVPVYAALVPDIDTDKSKSSIYIVLITSLLSTMGSVPKYKRLKSEMIWNYDDESVVEEFLQKHVASDTTLLDLQKGIISPVYCPQLIDKDC